MSATERIREALDKISRNGIGIVHYHGTALYASDLYALLDVVDAADAACRDCSVEPEVPCKTCRMGNALDRLNAPDRQED